MKKERTTESFGELIFKERAILYNLALQKTKNPVDAEELVSETFAKALEKQHLYTDKGYLKYWLLRILKNILTDKHRRQKNFTVVYPETDFAFQQRYTQNLGFSNLRLEEIMEQILKLPPELQQPVLLRTEDREYKEIAEIIGIPQGTMGPRLMRARKLLRKTIEL